MSNDDVPEAVLEEIETLTRQARRASDPGEARAYRERREQLLSEYDYASRIREDDLGETLVVYPNEWQPDGTVDIDAIEDTDRAVEISLSGPTETSYETASKANEAIVDAVEQRYGDPHIETARALAAYANNHLAKPIPALSAAELETFRSEFFPRNAWPSDAQREALERSLTYIYACTDVSKPN